VCAYLYIFNFFNPNRTTALYTLASGGQYLALTIIMYYTTITNRSIRKQVIQLILIILYETISIIVFWSVLEDKPTLCLSKQGH